MRVIKADAWHMATDGSQHLKRATGNRMVHFSQSLSLKVRRMGKEIIKTIWTLLGPNFPVFFKCPIIKYRTCNLLISLCHSTVYNNHVEKSIIERVKQI